jgi:hypothetical protein
MPANAAWRRLPFSVHSVNATSITTCGFTHREARHLLRRDALAPVTLPGAVWKVDEGTLRDL